METATAKSIGGEKMRKKDLCQKCGSDKQTEVITGGITITIERDGEFTVKDTIEYEKSDKHSRWFCTDCKEPFKPESAD